ncbi:hypothetical protein BST81_15190 [Leptolyngbya sp. 'hensonii']|uniref:serine/threonine-protein kinase n=1 Tax=Leptolyngbya sp. 'hensonii' TaxID=1922337 RepID=UPI00094F65E1|nr:serine/threonine-protein kinase [Leptolyngbya sp. 'hensonii']OLP17662.1 hypothetical protein BST81_15190 [Leptolyngbya sp. 'hensonii']
MTLYCSQNHTNQPGSRFCSICGERLPQAPIGVVTLGMVLGDRYRILQELGRGGFGRTYLAEDINRFNEKCVLKQFAPQVHGEEALRKAQELFSREAGVLYKLQHPQIPRFRELFQSSDRLFLVQDYVAGPTYRNLLMTRKGQGQHFHETEITQLLVQILPVLQYIHTLGVVHRDIAPDNLICREGDRQPILIDFGGVKQVAAVVASHLVGQQGPPPSATRLGKVGYAPPEQMQFGMASPHSDLYALGMTSLVLLTGQEPQDLLDGRTPLWQWPEVAGLSPSLQGILTKMLADRPGDRYSSATDVLRDLEGEAGGPANPGIPFPLRPPPYTPTQATRATPVASRKITQPRQGVGLVGILWMLVTIGAVGVGSWWAMRRAIETSQPPKIGPSPSRSPSVKPTVSPFSKEEQARKEALGHRRTKLGIAYDYLVQAVNPIFYRQHPDLGGRQLSTGPEDADLRRQWDETAHKFLTQLAGLRPESRAKLGQFTATDLNRWKDIINKLNLSQRALYDLTDIQFFELFPDQRDQKFIDQPIGQVWYAIAADYVVALQSGKALEKVQFDNAAYDKQLKGTLEPGEGKAYIAFLTQDQLVRLSLQVSPKVLLSFYPPTRDRPALLQRSTERAWSGTLNQSGFYEIVLVSTAGEALAYQLDLAADNVTTSPSPEPSPSSQDPTMELVN